MLRQFTIYILWVFLLWIPTAHAVPGLDRYQTDLGQRMETVLQGAALSEAFKVPVLTPKISWEMGVRAGIERAQPVTANVAALALNWTFYKANKPFYIAQVVVLATAAGPRLMRLERKWSLATSPQNSAPSMPGKPPNEWPGMFKPWAMLVAAFQKSATLQSCPQLPIATVDTLQSVPMPYRDAQRKTLDTLAPLRDELCEAAYKADSVTMMPVRQHFNLLGPNGTIKAGISIDFAEHPNGIAIVNPQFKQIGGSE